MNIPKRIKELFKSKKKKELEEKTRKYNKWKRKKRSLENGFEEITMPEESCEIIPLLINSDQRPVIKVTNGKIKERKGYIFFRDINTRIYLSKKPNIFRMMIFKALFGKIKWYYLNEKNKK